MILFICIGFIVFCFYSLVATIFGWYRFHRLIILQQTQKFRFVIIPPFYQTLCPLWLVPSLLFHKVRNNIICKLFRRIHFLFMYIRRVSIYVTSIGCGQDALSCGWCDDNILPLQFANGIATAVTYFILIFFHQLLSTLVYFLLFILFTFPTLLLLIRFPFFCSLILPISLPPPPPNPFSFSYSLSQFLSFSIFIYSILHVQSFVGRCIVAVVDRWKAFYKRKMLHLQEVILRPTLLNTIEYFLSTVRSSVSFSSQNGACHYSATHLD